MTAIDPNVPRAVPPPGLNAPPPSPAPSAATTAAPVPASVRVQVWAADRALVPMTLPARAPLSMLIDPTVRAASDRLIRQGSQPLPERTRFEFARVDGSLLSDNPATTLAACGLKDGDLLRLVPVGQAVRFVPRIENLGTALSVYLRGVVHPVRKETAHTVAVGSIIVGSFLAAGTVWRTRWALESGWAVVPTAVLAILAMLAWVATRVTSMRWPEFIRVRDAFAATAIVLSGAALASVPPGLGPANVFAGAFPVAVGAMVMAARTQRYWAAATAVLGVGGLSAGLALWSLFWPLSSYQAAVASLLAVTVLITAAPRLGLSLGRVPRQPFRSRRGRDQFDRAEGEPMDTVSPVPDAYPDPTSLSTAEVAVVATRARSVLIGLCVTVGVAVIVATWVAITPHSNRPVWTIVLASIVSVDLIIRARKFNDRVQAVLLVGSAVVALMGIAYKYAWMTPAADFGAVMVFIGIASLISATVFFIGSAGWRYLFSPNTRKAVEYLGNLLIALVVPLGAYLLNIFEFARTQGLWWL